jgi:hypothetical protein
MKKIQERSFEMNGINHVSGLGALLVSSLFLAMFSADAHAQNAKKTAKPRVVVTTDGEADDRCSMVRFLMYANEWDIRGIIHSSSKHHWKGDESTPRHKWEPVSWLGRHLDAYEKVYPNLTLHNPDFPAPEYLRFVVFVGNITAEGDMRKETPGSNRIVEVLLEPDTSPVWLQAWGGSNTIARALKTIQEKYPDRVEEVSKKARLYLISEQDNTLKTYIRPEWPGLQVLRSNAASYGVIAYHWQKVQPKRTRAFFDQQWMTEHILQDHGALCGLYETKKGNFRSEGDSPAFLHVINTGLRSDEHPSYGGWGGRFSKQGALWKPVDKAGVFPHSILRWAEAFQNDWAARADWCVASPSEANHPPVVMVGGALDQGVKPGATVTLNGEGSRDPDGDGLSFRWWQYAAASSASMVRIVDETRQNGAYFIVPDEPGKSIHILLEATDNGAPPLTRWQRIIYTITR